MSNTNIRFSVVHTNKTTLENTVVSNGSVYFVEDTKELFYDFDSKRVGVKDILILEKESERTSILFTPLNKFYFVLETQILWLYKDGSWYKITADNTLVDNITIRYNSSNALQVIGSVTRNGILKYDWVGTQEEYETGVLSGIITSNTLCLITDDEQDFVTLENYYTKSEIDNMFGTVESILDQLIGEVNIPEAVDNINGETV